MLIRDGTQQANSDFGHEQAHLTLTRGGWSSLVSDLRSGLELGWLGNSLVAEATGPIVALSIRGRALELRIGADEWRAFTHGVQAGNFDDTSKEDPWEQIRTTPLLRPSEAEQVYLVRLLILRRTIEHLCHRAFAVGAGLTTFFRVTVSTYAPGVVQSLLGGLALLAILALLGHFR